MIAVAGVLAAPAVGPTLEAVRMEAAARRAAAFLDDARRRAVLERKELVVRCRPAAGRLELSGSAGGERVFAVPEDVTLASCSAEEVRYQPQGSASGLSLLLRDRSGRGRRLSVGAFTGLARVEIAE